MNPTLPLEHAEEDGHVSYYVMWAGKNPQQLVIQELNHEHVLKSASWSSLTPKEALFSEALLESEELE